MAKGTVLIVDDNSINRKILNKILSSEYTVIEAVDGAKGLEIFDEKKDSIAAIMLDLVMPVMDGYEFLKEFSQREDSDKVPVIVSTGQTDKDNEVEALRLGAWDFVAKPYFPEIIHFRLKNAILRSQLTAFQELKYKSEYDVLTAIYNKDKFFAETREMLLENPDREFAFFRFDIDRFHLVNSYFGTQMGDRLLQYIANGLKEYCKKKELSRYGRIEADVFAFCIELEENEKLEEAALSCVEHLANFNLAFDVVPSFGICRVADHSMPIDKIYDRATLAAKTCKGNYLTNYAVYEESMGKAVEQEQEIINDMNAAIKEEQFEIWYQPKFDIQRNVPAGAEALVRWRHPEKGMISPAYFIPVFEHNGFISKLDNYVWEHVCRTLRKWMDSDRKPLPVSVNLSRVELSDPTLIDRIVEITDRYGIPHDLFNLELTESAYTDNPEKMIELMKSFQEQGFIIMMDDFGSGYSSLSVLKDIDVNVLKIDMRFFEKTAVEGREKSIIASVIRMAKWLGIPVVAEGVEIKEQVEFLKGLGCEYVQGYYFAKPMPEKDYLEYIDSHMEREIPYEDTRFNADILWHNEIMLSNLTQPSAVFEYAPGDFEIIHVNNSFYDLFGYRDRNKDGEITFSNVDSTMRAEFRRVLVKETESKQGTEMEYKRRFPDGNEAWISMKVKFISRIGEKSLLYAVFTDVTALKKIDEELSRYINAEDSSKGRAKLAVIGECDKQLADEFRKEYELIQIKGFEEESERLKQAIDGADTAFIDTDRPATEARVLLEAMKADESLAAMPVVVLTSNNNEECRLEMERLGVSDYIMKPCSNGQVRVRVKKILERNRVLRTIKK